MENQDRFKFRVYDKEAKKYLYEGKGCSIFGEMMVFGGWLREIPIEDFNNLVAEQCTGLSATKSYRGTGREDLLIYEGDIISGCNGSVNGHDWPWGPYTIIFKDGKFNVPLWGTLENQDSTHWFGIIGTVWDSENNAAGLKETPPECD